MSLPARPRRSQVAATYGAPRDAVGAKRDVNGRQSLVTTAGRQVETNEDGSPILYQGESLQGVTPMANTNRNVPMSPTLPNGLPNRGAPFSANPSQPAYTPPPGATTQAVKVPPIGGKTDAPTPQFQFNNPGLTPGSAVGNILDTAAGGGAQPKPPMKIPARPVAQAPAGNVQAPAQPAAPVAQQPAGASVPGYSPALASSIPGYADAKTPQERAATIRGANSGKKVGEVTSPAAQVDRFGVTANKGGPTTYDPTKDRTAPTWIDGQAGNGRINLGVNANGDVNVGSVRTVPTTPAPATPQFSFNGASPAKAHDDIPSSRTVAGGAPGAIAPSTQPQSTAAAVGNQVRNAVAGAGNATSGALGAVGNAVSDAATTTYNATMAPVADFASGLAGGKGGYTAPQSGMPAPGNTTAAQPTNDARMARNAALRGPFDANPTSTAQKTPPPGFFDDGGVAHQFFDALGLAKYPAVSKQTSDSDKAALNDSL